MKKLILLFLLLISVINIALGQIQFENTYPNANEYDYGVKVYQLNDTGYVFLNETSLRKTDSLGNLLWGKSTQTARDFVVSGDTAFVVLQNHLYDLPLGEGTMCSVTLSKFSNEGIQLGIDTVISYTLTRTIVYAIDQTHDGGFIIGGNVAGYVNIFKTDYYGNIEWTKSYPDGMMSYNCTAYSIIQTFDNGYLFTGEQEYSAIYTSYVIRTDSLGNVKWHNEYEYGVLRSIMETNDSCYLVTGYEENAHPYYFWTIKIDSAGNNLWRESIPNPIDIGQSTEGHSTVQTNDECYVSVGFLDNWPEENGHIFLAKRTEEGDTLWTKILYNKGEAVSIKQTFDKGFIITGKQSGDVLLMKTDSLGNLCSTFILSNNQEGFNIYPNPVCNDLNIQHDKNVRVSIYNIEGNLLYEIDLKEGIDRIDISNLSNGVYFVKINSEETTTIKKIMKYVW